jgi:hypothetical protein
MNENYHKKQVIIEIVDLSVWFYANISFICTDILHPETGGIRQESTAARADVNGSRRDPERAFSF